MPDLLGDLGGQTSNDYAIADGAKPLVQQCTPDQVLKAKQCNDLKFVVIDAAKMPFIARNIQLAWLEGKPFLLHKNSGARKANYAASCSSFVPKYAAPVKGSCDEYSFASTSEGGAGSRTEEVSLREQSCQGGTLSRAYQDRPIADGEQFVVVIASPAKIDQSAFAGVDIAKDQSCTI